MGKERRVITKDESDGYYDLEKKQSVIGPPPDDARVVGHVEGNTLVVEEATAEENAADVEAIAKAHRAKITTTRTYSSRRHRRSHHSHHSSSRSHPPTSQPSHPSETPVIVPDTRSPIEKSPEENFSDYTGRKGIAELPQTMYALVGLSKRRFSEGFNALSGGLEAIREDWKAGKPLRAIGRAINGIVAGAGWTIMNLPDTAGKAVNAAVHDIPPEYWDTAASQKAAGIGVSAAVGVVTSGLAYVDAHVASAKPGTIAVRHAYYSAADDTLNATLEVTHRTGLGRTIRRTIGVTDRGVGRGEIQIVRPGKVTHTKGWSIRGSVVASRVDDFLSISPSSSRTIYDVIQKGDDVIIGSRTVTRTPSSTSTSIIVGRKVSGTPGGKMKIEISGYSQTPATVGQHTYLVEGTVHVGDDLARIGTPDLTDVADDTLRTLRPGELRSIIGSADDVAGGVSKGARGVSKSGTPMGQQVISIPQNSEASSVTQTGVDAISNAVHSIVSSISDEVSSAWKPAIAGSTAGVGASVIGSILPKDVTKPAEGTSRRGRTIPKLRQEPWMDVKVGQEPLEGLKELQEQLQDELLGQDISPDFGVPQRSEQRARGKQRVKGGNIPTYPTPTYSQVPAKLPPPPVPIKIPEIPRLRPRSGRRAVARKKTKPQSARYKPSLVAIGFGIKASAPKVLTGVEIRPIAGKPRKREKKKKEKKKKGGWWLI